MREYVYKSKNNARLLKPSTTNIQTVSSENSERTTVSSENSHHGCCTHPGGSDIPLHNAFDNGTEGPPLQHNSHHDRGIYNFNKTEDIHMFYKALQKKYLELLGR